jgi:hypothetical protein
MYQSAFSTGLMATVIPSGAREHLIGIDAGRRAELPRPVGHC